MRAGARGHREVVSELVEVPRQPYADRERTEAGLVVDAAIGVVGASVGTGLALVRATAEWAPLRSPVLWRPAYVPVRWQPASLLTAVADRWQASLRGDESNGTGRTSD